MPGSATELNGQVLQRSCPKCNGYLGIVVPERKVKMPVQAINGRCLKCGYRLAWVLVRGKTSAELRPRSFYAR
jgi:C4-type Zn-finger protein